MKNTVAKLVLMAALMGSGMSSWADDVNATGRNIDPVKHPVNAYRNHEVKEDMKDSQVNSQKATEAKAAYEQAKTNYEKSLKDNGADSAVTQDAKKRMHDARKEMRKYNVKTQKANKELRKDEIKAQK